MRWNIYHALESDIEELHRACLVRKPLGCGLWAASIACAGGDGNPGGARRLCGRSPCQAMIKRCLFRERRCSLEAFGSVGAVIRRTLE